MVSFMKVKAFFLFFYFFNISTHIFLHQQPLLSDCTSTRVVLAPTTLYLWFPPLAGFLLIAEDGISFAVVCWITVAVNFKLKKTLPYFSLLQFKSKVSLELSLLFSAIEVNTNRVYRCLFTYMFMSQLNLSLVSTSISDNNSCPLGELLGYKL